MTIRHLYPAVEPSLNLDFANSKRLDPRITFTRASTGTYTDESGIIRTAAANEARFDHDSDGNSLGLLIEESRTNLWLDSDDPTQKGTANASCTLDPSVLDPLGNSSGKIEITAVNTYQLWRQTGFSLTSGSYTFSVYLKAGTISSVTLSSGNSPNAVFDIANGAVTSETGCTAKIQSAANGWFRCSITWTATNTTEIRTWTTNQSIGSYYFVAAAQVEAGSFPTSYIPTSGSTVTRSADVASISGTNFTSWYNQNGGTIFTSYSGVYHSPWTLGSSQSPRLILGWFDNEVQIYDGTSDTRVVFPGDYPTTTSTTKEAVGLDSQNLSAARDGSVNTKTHSSVITGLYSYARLEIGLTSNTSRRLNGHISRLTYYPVRLPDATLQALTL